MHADAAPGDFDTRFGSRGVLDLTAASSGRVAALASGMTIAHGPGGVVYAGGGVLPFQGLASTTFVARATGAGALDPAFGADGVWPRAGFSANGAGADFIAALPSGRLVVSEYFSHECGTLCPPNVPASGRQASIFDAAGQIESGQYAAAVMHGNRLLPRLETVAAFRDGKIVSFARLAGASGMVEAHAIAAGGQRDGIFERNATAALVCGNPGDVMASITAAVDRQERVMVAIGMAKFSSPEQFFTCISRLDRDGNLDKTFGIGGSVILDRAALSALSPARIAFAAGGAARIAMQDGSAAVRQQGRMAQVRLTAAGALDENVDGGAVVAFDAPLAGPFAAIEPLADGRTLIAGSRGTSGAGATPAIAMMNGRGVETAFGPGGAGWVSLAPSADQVIVPQAIALAPDNSIHVLGSQKTTADANTPRAVVLAKLQGLPIDNAATAARYDGLWWRASEAGWGLGLSQQGGTLFAAWFTYDVDGKGLWLVMPGGTAISPRAFSGPLYRTSGPAFSARPFDPAAVRATAVGSATLEFTDADNGSFTYTVNGVTQSKPVTRQVFGTLPTCATAPFPGTTANYQGLWWNAPSASESGWGLYLSHQSDTVFGAWFTYDIDGRAQWLVMPSGTRATGATYRGTLYRATGPAFDAAAWNSAQVNSSAVGLVELAFTNADNAEFRYLLDGVSQVKTITRHVFGSPITVCH